MSETLRYWDLGVHIDKNSQTIIQKELDFDQIADINSSTINENQILAFRANNFIAPILHNLKYPLVESNKSMFAKMNSFFLYQQKKLLIL